jgi:hypothetical protein
LRFQQDGRLGLPVGMMEVRPKNNAKNSLKRVSGGLKATATVPFSVPADFAVNPTSLPRESRNIHYAGLHINPNTGWRG